MDMKRAFSIVETLLDAPLLLLGYPVSVGDMVLYLFIAFLLIFLIGRLLR